MSQTTSQSQSQVKKEKSPWLNAFRDPVANLDVCENAIKLVDMMGDGDNRLLIVDQQKKIISYKGTTIDWESTLNDVPIAIECFYPQGSNVPTIAFACDQQIYQYRCQKAIYRFPIPRIEMEQKEKALWEGYDLEVQQFKKFLEDLETLKKESSTSLSNLTLTMLSIQSTKRQYEFAKQTKNTSLSTPDTCVCMASIYSEQEAPYAQSQLILGTEQKKLIILDQQGFNAQSTISLNGTPVQIQAQGVLNSYNMIFVGMRENNITIIKNGQIQQNVINLNSKLCQFIRIDDQLYVGQMDDSVSSFNHQGVKKFSIKMNSNICAIENMEYKRSKFSGYLVALKNQEIRIYKDKLLVYIFNSEGIVSAMKFGAFGREEGSLILIYKQIGLDVKMLIRQFNFQHYLNQAQQKQNQQNQEDVQPLNLPKKTKLFLENSIREIENPVPIHRAYTKDLMKLRLQTATTYLNILSEGNVQNMLANESNLRMQAQICGLGPVFKISFTVENLSSDPMRELYINYCYDQNIFKINKPVYTIPFLLPNISYPVEIQVENIDENGTGDLIKILICERKNSNPLIGALVQMPLSELRQ